MSKVKEKGKGFAGEFKKFILRGNVIDLAVGVIIGAAFQAIVNSLVNDIIMPVLSLITKGIDFNEMFVALDGNTYESLQAATDAGAATLNYGVFIGSVINFIIMAFVIFLIVKCINKISEAGKKNKEKEPETTKTCPYCKSVVDIKASRCPNCTSELEVEEAAE